MIKFTKEVARELLSSNPDRESVACDKNGVAHLFKDVPVKIFNCAWYGERKKAGSYECDDWENSLMVRGK
jgi:hypothetical protein